MTKIVGILLGQLIITGKREHKPKVIELMGMHRDFVRIVRAGYHQRRAAAQRGMLSNVASLIVDGTRRQIHKHTPENILRTRKPNLPAGK